MAKKPNKQPIPQSTARPAPAAVTAKKETVGKAIHSTAAAFTVKQLILVLAAVSCLLYVNTLRNGYVLDDVMVLKENTYVMQGVKGIPDLLATPHMRGYLVIPNDLYRPLSLVVFAIEYQFFGPTPAVGHLFNILWFAGCVIFLFLFLDKFFGGKKTAIAFIAAFVFAVHPIHTEVVANIKSRDELMCYFFAFLSLNVFMNYMRDGKMKQLLLGVFIFFLALISKETVISFLGLVPFIFFLYDNRDTKRAMYITGGVVAATIVFMAIRSSVLAAYNANQSVPVEFIDNALSRAPSYASKVATEMVILGKYLKLMFIPYPLLCNYSFNAIPFADFASIGFWLSLAAYGFMIYVAATRFMKNKKDPWVFAIIFYLATLFLFSNIPFLMGAELAERFAFFASTGVCLAAALAVDQWILKGQSGDIMVIKSSKVLMVLGPLLLVFGGMTIARNADWRDEYNLYKTDVEKSPNDCRLYHYVATAMIEKMWPLEKDTVKQHEMDKESIDYLNKSLAIFSDYSEAHVELGRVYDRMHRLDSAEVHDRKAIELNPTNATATNNLGNVYLESGKYPQAIEWFRKAMILNPSFKYSYYNMGLSYKQLQRYDSAIYFFNKMLILDPSYISAHQEIGTAFFILQRYDSAEYHFKLVLGANPQDPGALHNMGAVYLNEKKYPQAIELFKQTIALSPTYTSAYSNLGKAYFFTGQYQLCVDVLTKEFTLPNRNSNDIPYVAISYKKLGNMEQAVKYETLAKQFFKDFVLP